MKHMGADWLQKQIDSLSKPYQLSPLARDVADIMGQLEYGIYHWETVVSSKGWKGSDKITLNRAFRLSTGLWGNSLTLLVLLCHKKQIQVTIHPSSPTSLGLSFVRATEQPFIPECIEDLKHLVEAIA